MKQRFCADNNLVVDGATGLMWSRDAAPAEFPLNWQETFAFLEELNSQGFEGHQDWRLPNRRELFSLIRHDRINPALPADHPFENVFPGYYWSATTSLYETRYAWALYLKDGAVGVGFKENPEFFTWPVRGGKTFQTSGQRKNQAGSTYSASSD
ncbi:MAG: DUF1566 domain-containing protein [Desulfosalsimonas sp.]|uniref:Lcl C-terminal domain-containing protein n=1 Tax=Desulfosalsimonas sp. TaxID=3073848 RepID=UPI003970AC6F